MLFVKSTQNNEYRPWIQNELFIEYGLHCFRSNKQVIV